MVLRLVADHEGNIAATARAIDVHRCTIHRWIVGVDSKESVQHIRDSHTTRRLAEQRAPGPPSALELLTDQTIHDTLDQLLPRDNETNPREVCVALGLTMPWADRRIVVGGLDRIWDWAQASPLHATRQHGPYRYISRATIDY